LFPNSALFELHEHARAGFLGAYFEIADAYGKKVAINYEELTVALRAARAMIESYKEMEEE